MEGYIDLKKLSMEELAGVVNLYPWFGAARKELCVRMCRAGGDGWGKVQYADAALYMGSRKMIADIMRSSGSPDCSDSEISEILKKVSNDLNTKKVHVAGGDYFTQEQYDLVRRQEDSMFSRFAAAAEKPSGEASAPKDDSLVFYTETLAQIYADQGYYDRAIEIYSKLILAYPEKNAYFAALIEKLNEEN
ncbi:MAG: hypothetical protein IAC23_02860 [Bacteroidetes bacterium]|uniref:Tetratricopeptide repeat protein n=1 Tax=Candidatus Cryptobacteroides merdavium TaxID=2840769 RepID=A0A9D9ED32_9BACT|nr:hypothetical protein [Candidatus Cryptobacteroides merdavium]